MKQHHVAQPIKLKKKKSEFRHKNGVFLKLADATRHHKVSSSIRAWVVILMVIEYIVCTLNCMFLWLAGMINTLYVRGYLEDLCRFQFCCCLGIFFIFPFLMLLSLWKKIFNITKFGFIAIGGLCILSGIMILLAYLLYLGRAENEEVLISDGGSAWLMLLIPLWGLGCIIRCWCGRKYGYVFYSISLMKSYRRGYWDFRILLAMFAFYMTIYIVVFSCVQ